jgi:hypothetical protein
MGVNMPSRADQDPEAALPAVILGRVIGHDAYRVLREGDTVVGMQVMKSPEARMSSIGSYRDLRAFLRNTAPGDWILVRLIRNGEAIETSLRLGLNSGAGRNENQDRLFHEAAKHYWATQFAPLFKGQSTAPAS